MRKAIIEDRKKLLEEVGKRKTVHDMGGDHTGGGGSVNEGRTIEESAGSLIG